MSRRTRNYADELHMPPNGTANVTIGVAVRIARAYPNTPALSAAVAGTIRHE